MTPPGWSHRYRAGGWSSASPSGDVADGWPQELRGGGLSGAGQNWGTTRYDLGAPFQVWEPGQLGASTPHFLGLYDRRPWLGQPSRSTHDWYMAVEPSQGEGLTLRVQVADAEAPLLTWDNRKARGALRQACLSVIIASFDDAKENIRRGGVSIIPDVPSPTSDWLPSRLASFGPNIMPELATIGAAEVDLDQWAGGGRFVAAWLFCYWVGVAAPDPVVPVHWTVWDRPPILPHRSGPTCISQPFHTVPDGPYDASDPAPWEIWTNGGWPLQGATHWRYAAVNGGAAPITTDVRHLVGPCPDVAALASPADVWVTPAGGTVVRDATQRTYGDSQLLWFCGHTAEEQDVGGPVILSATLTGS